jgi:hypothetical protein
MNQQELAAEARWVERQWRRIELEDRRTLTMNSSSNGTVTVTKDKGEMCLEGWKELGGQAKAEQVQAWVKVKYGVEPSIPTVRKMKPDEMKRGGGGKGEEAGGGEVTATELRKIKAISAEGEGLAELEALLARAQEIADATGSLERAREVAATLRELTTK